VYSVANQAKAQARLREVEVAAVKALVAQKEEALRADNNYILRLYFTIPLVFQ
jgi:hypothetical protein